MDTKSNRTHDTYLNDCIVEYLDHVIYPQIPSLSTFKRYEDTYTQLKEVDLVFSYGSASILCDEKSAVNWAGTWPDGREKLTSFILEISSRTSGGNIVNGWFIDNDTMTQYYMFIWLPEVRNNQFNTPNDIIQIDLALVSKQAIMQWLAKRGWTREKLIKKAKNIRYRRDRHFGPVDGVKFTYSEQLSEQPINIKLAKSTYKELATAFYSFREGVLQPGFIENYSRDINYR